MSRMRWIHHSPDGRRQRGEDAPGELPSEGVLHMVGWGTRAAVVDGVLYVDGRPASPGQRAFEFRDGRLPVTIVKGGRPTFGRVERGGGNGGNRP